jgi:hypothetical protein
MHNGVVLAQTCNDKHWWKLTPAAKGSYVGGTWTAIASLPVISTVQYAPLYYASQVLPDGRLEIEGGEYNGTGTEEWVSYGAIYSQGTNTWTAVNPPAGVLHGIGDSQSVLLNKGQMMLGVCCNYDGPQDNALFNPTTLTWSTTGAPDDYQDEQGYELLPNGTVLTINVWSPPATQLYNPTSGTWSAGQNTPVTLPDTCGNYEIGPAVVRGNQTLVAFSGDTCGVAAAPTAIRNNTNGTWSTGPTIPTTCGSGTAPCDLADAPAALEGNGKILFGASSGYGDNPTHFFEMNLSNTISAVADHPEASGLGAYTFNFLVLPTGQIMVTDFETAYVYTPSGTNVAAWAPTITTAPPANVTRGTAYSIMGTQLNGRSAGAYYGDDWQSFTNFPLVQVVNNASGHVAYGNSTNFSSFTIKQNASTSFKFTLPGSAQTGASKLYVVANGLRSAPVSITVH